MVQHRRVPLQLQEVKQLPHFLLRVQHELLVADGQTRGLPGGLTLAEHGLHRAAPLGQTVPVAGQVEAGDGHL